MEAVVLAAGEGTRLRPLTESRPKALVEVAGTPILTHCFEELAGLGVEEVVVVVGYRGQEIVDRYGSEFEGIPLTYVRQSERRGVAHALRSAREEVAGTFVLMFGDYVFGTDLGKLVERHRSTGAAGTLLVDDVDRETAKGHGVCEFVDGDLVGITEKPADPPSTLVTTGCFVFEPVVFPACEVITPSDRGEYELPAAVDLLLYAGHEVELVRADDWLVNVNRPADVERAERLLD